MRAQALLLLAKRAFSSSPPTQATTTSPLKGVKVLDLTRVLAGPFATMVLSDLGAEVIKVERPGGGDDTRAWGPPFLHSEQGRESAYFLSVNRNKQSICVDMKSERGMKILHQLAAKADILVENYLPGKVTRRSPPSTPGSSIARSQVLARVVLTPKEEVTMWLRQVWADYFMSLGILQARQPRLAWQ